jgi:hypothetical protein
MGLFSRLFQGNGEQAQRCMRCGVAMEVYPPPYAFDPTALRKAMQERRVRGAFQCGHCQQYTCFECSDGTAECQCGRTRWLERFYKPIGPKKSSHAPASCSPYPVSDSNDLVAAIGTCLELRHRLQRMVASESDIAAHGLNPGVYREWTQFAGEFMKHVTENHGWKPASQSDVDTLLATARKVGGEMGF